MSNPEGGRQPNPNESNGLKSQSRRDFLEITLGAGAALALGGTVDSIITTNNLINRDIELRNEYDPLSAKELGKGLEICAGGAHEETVLSQTKKSGILKRVRDTIAYDRESSKARSENMPRFLLDSALAVGGLLVGFASMTCMNKKEQPAQEKDDLY